MKHFSHSLFSGLVGLGSFLVAATAALCLVVAPTTAWASSAEDRLGELLEEAEEGYDMLYFEDAEEAIREGIQLADREDIRSQAVAELYVLLALIRHADGEDTLAEDAFVQAIETYPDIEVDPFYRTPATEELMERAGERADPPPFDEPGVDPPDDDPSPDIDDPPPEDEVDPLTHSPIPRADAGESLVFRAEIPADLPIFRVHIHHRRFGEDDFVQDEMDPTDATGFSYTLDANQVHTSQIEYFITAIDRSGDVVAESGRRTNPHRISVIGDADRTDTPPDGDVPVDPDDDPRPPDATGFFGALAFGTDLGFLPGGTPPTANQDRSVSPGIAPAFAHSLIDLGWRLTENNNVGMYFRWQFAPAQDFSSPVIEDNLDHDASFVRHQDECFGFGLPGDCLLGLKYERIVSTDVPEFYSSVGLGVGRVRNWLKLKQTTAPEDSEESPDPACLFEDGSRRETHFDDDIGHYCELRDTVRTGWFHFGVGGGMYIPITDMMDLVTDTYLMVHVPDTSVNLDINIGMRFRL